MEQLDEEAGEWCKRMEQSRQEQNVSTLAKITGRSSRKKREQIKSKEQRARKKKYELEREDWGTEREPPEQAETLGTHIVSETPGPINLQNSRPHPPRGSPTQTVCLG